MNVFESFLFCSFLNVNGWKIKLLSLCLPQRPSLVTVVEWIDYETLALLFGMVRLTVFVKYVIYSSNLLLDSLVCKNLCRFHIASLTSQLHWPAFLRTVRVFQARCNFIEELHIFDKKLSTLSIHMMWTIILAHQWRLNFISMHDHRWELPFGRLPSSTAAAEIFISFWETQQRDFLKRFQNAAYLNLLKYIW